MPDTMTAGPAETELSSYLGNLLSRYRSQFLPFEEALVSRAGALRGRTAIEGAAGRAGAGVAGQTTAAYQGVQAGLSSQGIDPSSGRFTGAMSDITGQVGFGIGTAANRAALNAEARGHEAALNVMARGGKLETRGILGLSRTAYYQDLMKGEKLMSDAQRKALKRAVAAGWWGAGGTAMGMAAEPFIHKWMMKEPQKGFTSEDARGLYSGEYNAA